MEYSVKDLETWNAKIEKLVHEFGLKCYDQEFQLISYNDMIALEAYTAMPARYPHWSFGKSYEKTKTLYKYNLTGLPYEMVINTDPCIAYLMKDNTLLLQILTIAHVYGHNDFFANNRLFVEGTDASTTTEMFKLHGDRVRSYINDPSIGYAEVERILDAAHALKLQTSRVVGEKRVSEQKLRQRLIDDYENKVEGTDFFGKRNDVPVPNIDKIPIEPEEDLLYFIIKYGKLAEWEKTLLEIVRQETNYFLPQIETKIMNEGWASYWHYTILNALDLPSGLHLEFLKRHNDVIAPALGGVNPYYVGFKIFEYLDKTYGRDKIFEVRTMDRDSAFLRRYLTEDLCRELNLFEYKKTGNDYVIKEVSDEEGWKEIRNNLSSSCGLGSVPIIRVVDMSKKDYTLTLEHVYDGRELSLAYGEPTLKYVQELWGRKVVLLTVIDDKKVRLVCDDKKIVKEIIQS
ncbi:SpoVR family protein [Clostridium cellulovorans]|uniref:SpoVR family protein n=1 Tax=Clostridium cellulovorans (strain ATCC 35296 / DSM 3052 / OCM 3 / 743B) TaxID=573061 RepID=D9SMT9_CLOC7|nr:SpoVR family protein [Clostridium cellulovorans]ADL49874.1 SpoVR family protein [Clostridium cellulovorans 743B]